MSACVYSWFSETRTIVLPAYIKGRKRARGWRSMWHVSFLTRTKGARSKWKEKSTRSIASAVLLISTKGALSERKEKLSARDRCVLDFLDWNKEFLSKKEWSRVLILLRFSDFAHGTRSSKTEEISAKSMQVCSFPLLFLTFLIEQNKKYTWTKKYNSITYFVFYKNIINIFRFSSIFIFKISCF